MVRCVSGERGAGKDGSWLAHSLNENEEDHISPDTARFMNDAATAYAVLALSEPKLTEQKVSKRRLAELKNTEAVWGGKVELLPANAD